MKIRTAIALAALAVAPAFAAEKPAATTATDAAMSPVEKSTVESLQKEIAMLQQTVEQIRRASAERESLRTQQQTDVNSP